MIDQQMTIPGGIMSVHSALAVGPGGFYAHFIADNFQEQQSV